MVTVDRKKRQETQRTQGTGKGRPSKLNECDKDQIVIKYNAGRPVTEIAKSFGINRGTVYRIVKERSTDV